MAICPYSNQQQQYCPPHHKQASVSGLYQSMSKAIYLSISTHYCLILELFSSLLNIRMVLVALIQCIVQCFHGKHLHSQVTRSQSMLYCGTATAFCSSQRFYYIIFSLVFNRKAHSSTFLVKTLYIFCQSAKFHLTSH